ncbi:hypothetical protein GCM10007963_25100 [Lutibacter litoralis]|nr:hypothetical protein GCM10007963_25100 [Lutibacter litoralis]
MEASLLLTFINTVTSSEFIVTLEVSKSTETSVTPSMANIPFFIELAHPPHFKFNISSIVILYFLINLCNFKNAFQLQSSILSNLV